MVPLSHSNPDPNVYLRSSTLSIQIRKGGKIDWEGKEGGMAKIEKAKQQRAERSGVPISAAAGIPASDTKI